MARLTDQEIEKEVEKDMRNRDAISLEKLSQFYFKIVTEGNISVTSFRYYYAKKALVIICTKLDDTETISNLNNYHIQKMTIEANTPKVKEEDISNIKLDKNRASIAERRVIVDKRPGQFKI